jgi:hypothetical protein
LVASADVAPAPLAPATEAKAAAPAAKPATKAKAEATSAPAQASASAKPSSQTPVGPSPVSEPDAPEASDADARPASVEAEKPAQSAPAAHSESTATATTPTLAIPTPQAQALASPAVRAAPETVAKLAAQIVRKLDGKSSRFDVSLDPAGLGRVNVRVEIGAKGQVTAALSFDSPAAAAELRGRADELRQALQQAGFDVSRTGLSFADSGQGQAGQNAARRALPARPGWTSSSETDDAVAAVSNSAPMRRNGARGVDIRI